MTEGLEIFGKTVFDALFMDWRVMVTVAIFSIIVFFVGLYLQLDKWGQGVPEGATKPAGAWGTLKLIVHKIFERGIGPALVVIILDVFLQRRTWRRRKTEWLMHILIFWGWVGLFILTVTAAAAEFYGPFVLGTGHQFFADVPPARFTSIDWITLGGLSIVIITGFWAQGLRVGYYGIEERMLTSAYEAVAPGFFNNTVVLFHGVFTLLFCVAYLPFSKLFHMFVTPLVIMIHKGGYVEVNP